MRPIDRKKANFPRPDTNRYLVAEAECNFEGVADETIKFIEEFQLTDAKQWERFVEQYHILADGDDRGWRGEYWGKMMRGACFVYSYTKHEDLYNILTHTVTEMVKSSEEDGRLSTYPREQEFTGWDLWCRKYIMLGMQYYLEICKDENLAESIVANMCGQADYIISKVGLKKEGKKPITEAASMWRGINSSSLLEPIVRLYNITKEEKYLDFAQYIVDAGGLSVANIFELAYKNQFYPYQYPMTKAYEMISCFEGLLEFYRVKKEDRHKTALINFADRVLESDFTIIGGSGCTHELFDHSTVRQANTNNGAIMQETCVTVTLMKFMYQMTLLTGNAAYVDAFERSFYNAYLGAVNTEKVVEPSTKEFYPEAIIEPLPFDSYSPLTPGTRGNGIGGLRLMADSHYYGCCACIGSCGAGLIPKMALMKASDGIVVNLYVPGVIETESPSGAKIKLTFNTEYPKEGVIKIKVNTKEQNAFVIRLRNPNWSKRTEMMLNHKKLEVTEGYIILNRQWSDGDEIELIVDMRTEAIYPISYGHQILMNHMLGQYDYVVPYFDEEDPVAKHHLALRRGPLVMAVDSRLGRDAGDVFDIDVSEDGYVKTQIPEVEVAPYKHMVELQVPLKNHSSFRVTDYASAGKLWTEQSKMAAWILTAANEC